MDSLVTTHWLAEHLPDPHLRLVDTRWYLLKPGKGREEYQRGHIPGAGFMDVDGDLAKPERGSPGRHPLPNAEEFAEVASRAGIGADTPVVAYDDAGGANAARLWWLLRYFGHARVSLLDGGIAQWVAEGRALESEVPCVTRTAFVPRPPPAWVVDKHAVNILRDDPRALVLDSRAAERYAGTFEPIDPRAGHIPGAKNAPFTGNLHGSDDPRWLDVEQLRARFEALGAEEAEQIVVYCGSGINACQNIFALHLAGFENVSLYEGSWSDWSRDPDLPMAVGLNPR